MKKSLIVTLALIFVLGIAGTAFANPYSDVPAGHWAYKAVVDLQKAGVMEGAGGKFMGNQTLTRYEIAAITARAMAKADKADAATKATIDKLAVEFSKELNDLGVRVAKLEKQGQNLKWAGQLRVRHEGIEKVSGITEGSAYKHRLRLFMTAGIDENWTFKGRLAQEAVANAANNNIQMDQAYITGKLGEATLEVGRMPNVIGQMLVSGSTANWDGVTLAGKVADVNLKVGVLEKSGFNNNEFIIGDASYKVTDDVTVNATYMKDTAPAAAHTYETFAYGVKYTGIEKFTIAGEFATNKADLAKTAGKDADAQWISVKYMGAKAAQPGTFGVWVAYKKADPKYDIKDYNGGDATSAVSAFTGAGRGTYYDDVKGYEYGFDYTVFKNGVLSVQYYDQEKDSNGVDYPKQVLAALTVNF